MKADDVQNNLEVAVERRKRDMAVLEGKLTVKIDEISGKVDGICEKLTDHIAKQDSFEKRIESRMEDLGFILRVFRWMGWAITIASGVIITWVVNNILNGGK